jgi:predicted dehydrogenase
MNVEQNNKPIKVAFIGGGLDSAIGRAHFGAIHIDRKYSLIAGMFSIDKTINESSGRFYGVDSERIYENIPTLLASERSNLDAVILLTPTPLHFEHINQILDAGIPIISEKALCTSSKDARFLAQRISDEKKFLTVTFTYTGYPMIREIKRMIGDGLLGDLLSIHIEMPQESFIRATSTGSKPEPQQWRQHDYEIPSVTLDLGSHVINLLQFITNDSIARITAVAEHSGEVSNLLDNVMAIGTLQSGAALSLNWNKVSLGKRNGLACTIYGSNGALSWEQENPEYLRYAGKDGAIRILDRSHSMVTHASADRYQRFKIGHPAGYIEAFANLYGDIADDVHSFIGGKSIENPYTHSPENSADGLYILEALHESALSKKWIDIKR